MNASTFFSKVSQDSLKIRDFDAKAPVFYRKLNVTAGVFSGDLDVIRSCLPDPRLAPICISKKRGLVAIHCLEYAHSDIGPYNELSLSFPVRFDKKFGPSLGAFAKSMFTGRFEAFVRSLPVTTEIALHGGVDFYNYPKYLADLTFHETATHRTCTLRDRDTLDLILAFESRRLATRKAAREVEMITYPQKKDGQLLQATVRMNWLQHAMSFSSASAALRLGPSPHAGVFKELRLGQCLAYLYVPQAEGILFLPKTLEPWNPK